MTSHPDSQRFRTLPTGRPIETEHRITTLEIKTSRHEERHDTQDTWNKAFAIALAGLSAGLAHSKADEWAGVLHSLLGLFLI